MRAEIAGKDYWPHLAFEFLALSIKDFDRLTIDLGERFIAITQLFNPVRTCAPGWRFKNEACAMGFCNFCVARVVGHNDRRALFVSKQVKGGKLWKVKAIVENECGLKPAVGQEDV